MAPKWTEEQKQKALAIAEAVSLTEAARVTGIPRGTIGRWRHEAKHKGTETGETKRSKKLEVLRHRVVEQAVAEAGEYIAERLKGLADDLYSLAQKATDKVNIAISDPEELPPGKQGEPHDRDGAAWVRALVGVMAQAIDKAQLLSGKPTIRPEVSNRYEYEITQRIIAERPELLDAIFAEDKRPGLEDRGG